MLRAEKQGYVDNLEEICNQSSTIIFTHYHGLTVSEVSKLRRLLKENGAKFKVVKNTLFKIAAEKANVTCDANVVSGPVAIAYSKDPVSAAKAVVEFAKSNKNLKIVGGVMDKSPLTISTVQSLSKLPSLDELRGSLIALIQKPASNIAATLVAPAAQLARVFNAYATK